MGFNDINLQVSGPQQPASTYKTKVLKGQVPFATQVTEPNTKYVIKHNFVLNGDVTIPENCILEFDGGGLYNGNVTCNETIIEGDKIGNAVYIGTHTDRSYTELRTEVDELNKAVGAGGTVDERIESAVAPKANSSDVYNKAETYNKSETYSKAELNNMITTPNQQYVTVATYASLPATGSAETVYRVSNYNGSTNQVDATMYSEYAWNGSDYTFLCVKSQVSEVFDISAYNSNAKYDDLADALGTNGANIPESLRKGGMSVKYVQTSDNNYIQARLMADSFTTDVTLWQDVDDEPTDESKNLVESGGVFNSTKDLKFKKIDDNFITGFQILPTGVFSADSSGYYLTMLLNIAGFNKVYLENIWRNGSKPSIAFYGSSNWEPIEYYTNPDTNVFDVPSSATRFVVQKISAASTHVYKNRVLVDTMDMEEINTRINTNAAHISNIINTSCFDEQRSSGNHYIIKDIIPYIWVKDRSNRYGIFNIACSSTGCVIKIYTYNTSTSQPVSLAHQISLAFDATSRFFFFSNEDVDIIVDLVKLAQYVAGGQLVVGNNGFTSILAEYQYYNNDIYEYLLNRFTESRLKITCVGDSLTEGDYGSNPSGTINIHKENYPYFLQRYLDCTVYNEGKCGFTPINYWASKVQTIDWATENPDVVVIMLGTNNDIQNMGSLATDVEPYSDYNDYADTIVGDYCKIIEYINEQTNGTAQIILCMTPFVDADRSAWASDKAQQANAANTFIPDVAERYGLPLINTRQMGLSAINSAVFQPIDGLHFGEVGYSKLGTFIGSQVKSLCSFVY